MVKLRGNRALRALDRSGSVLLRAASVARKRRPFPQEIDRVGLLKTNAIGDTILLSAVIKDLAAALPAAELTLFAGPANAAVCDLIEGVSTLALPLSRPRESIRLLRERRLDMLLDFGAWPRINAIYAALAGAGYTVGFETAGQARHYCYDLSVHHSDDVHELDNYRELVRSVGVESTSVPSFRPSGALGPGELPRKPFVIFHLWPGGFRSELKEWPAPAWRELAGRMIHNGYMIVLTGAEADRPRTEAFLRSCGDDSDLVNVAGRYGFRQLVDLAAAAGCTVSVNTGVMHLAAATGAPTVGLNGPTAEHRWGPIGARARSVNSSFAGCGYLDLGFEYGRGRSDCMLGISVDAVEAAVKELVDG